MILNTFYLKSGIFSFTIHALILLYAYLQFEGFASDKQLIHKPVNVSLIEEQNKVVKPKNASIQKQPTQQLPTNKIEEFNSSVAIFSSTELTRDTPSELQQSSELTETFEELNLQYFVNKIIDSIEGAWRKPLNIQDGLSAQFLLRVSRTGKIMTYQLHKSSGNIRFDNSGLSAIKRVDKFSFFEEIPNEIYETELKVFILNFNP